MQRSSEFAPLCVVHFVPSCRTCGGISINRAPEIALYIILKGNAIGSWHSFQTIPIHACCKYMQIRRAQKTWNTRVLPDRTMKENYNKQNSFYN